jgi:hypothetical protein
VALYLHSSIYRHGVVLNKLSTGTTLSYRTNECHWCTTSQAILLQLATRRSIPGDDILHSHRRENLKSDIALTDWALWRRRNVSPVRYELGFFIPEADILRSHSREYFTSYIFKSSFLFVTFFSLTTCFRPIRPSTVVKTVMGRKLMNFLYLGLIFPCCSHCALM